MNKILILLVGVLVSIVIWAIGHHFFYFGFAQPITSLAVSLAVGLIVSLIVWIIGKTWSTQTQIFLAILLVSVAGYVALKVLFTVPSTVDVDVYCRDRTIPSVQYTDILVAHMGWVRWHFLGDPSTVVTLYFDKGFQPFGKATISRTVGQSDNEQAINAGAGYYKIGCGYPTGPPTYLDPMIHVPQ